MIIDFHVHCFPDNLAKRAIETLSKCSGISSMLDGTIGDVKKSMESSSIDASVVLSIATKPEQTEKINNWSSKIQNKNIIAFGSIHPDFKNWKDEIKRINEMGIKGIKFHPDYQSFYVDEKRMYPIYEHIFNLGLIVVFHAGIDIGLIPPYHCCPERLLHVVNDFNGGKIIAAHMGGFSYWDDVEKYLVGKDIYLDTSYSIGIMQQEQAKRIISDHGAHKILFATDSPWTNQKTELEKIKALELESEAASAILGANAMKLLGL